jgi:hypothetical protein
LKEFVDAAGRRWNLVLNLGTVLGVKDRLKVDLFALEEGEPPLITRLGTDPYLLANVIVVLLEPQFEKHGVTDKDIREAFDGPTLLASQTAFWDELADFSQSRGRPEQAKAIKAQTRVMTAFIAAAEKEIDGIDVDQVIRGTMSGASAASSASTPGRSA